MAHVLLVGFARGPLREDVKLDVDRFGIPSRESFQAVDVREHLRDTAPEWFEGWRTGALRAIASNDLGGDLSALDAADRCFTLEASALEPTDLGHLQAAWALARWIAARGVSVVLDAHAATFLAASHIRPVGAFDVRDEVRLIFETDEREPGAGHVFHSRGMKKFGRPDVVAIADPSWGPLLENVLMQLAAAMAQGFMPSLPRHGIDISDDRSLYLVEDEGNRLATALALNNDARVLVDEAGQPLTGLSKRATIGLA